MRSEGGITTGNFVTDKEENGGHFWKSFYFHVQFLGLRANFSARLVQTD